MSIEIRRTRLWKQKPFIKVWKSAETPTQVIASMAIIINTWFGRGHFENMSPEIQAHGPVIGKLLTQMLLDETGVLLKGCGKAGVVGMGGEIEYAQAMTRTLHLRNKFREAIAAKGYLAFSNTRGATDCAITIPLMDKHDEGLRSHYQTFQTRVVDVLADDEFLMALGASIGGHPNHRINDRYKDLKDLGRDLDNPAGV